MYSQLFWLNLPYNFKFYALYVKLIEIRNVNRFQEQRDFQPAGKARCILNINAHSHNVLQTQTLIQIVVVVYKRVRSCCRFI